MSEESNNAIDWPNSTLPQIPLQYRAPLILAALSGLRISECVKTCELIKELNKKGRLADYYDEELNLLRHFRFPQLFLRRTKNVYISFVSKELLNVLIKNDVASYSAIASYLKRHGHRVLIRQLLKYYATKLRKHLDREFIDILQGRIDPTVFTQDYYRPKLLGLRRKTLQTIKPLERELLSLI